MCHSKGLAFGIAFTSKTNESSNCNPNRSPAKVEVGDYLYLHDMDAQLQKSLLAI